MSKLLIKKCQENGITPNELMYLYGLVFPKEKFNFIGENKAIYGLMNNSLITGFDVPTDKGKRLIADYSNALSILEGKGKHKSKQVDESIIEAEITNWIDEYRNEFKGFKVGAMGDRKACINKMITFFKENPSYNDKAVVLRAARMYIASVNNPLYLMRADYFINKEDGNKNKVSTLAIFVEEVDMEKREFSTNTRMI